MPKLSREVLDRFLETEGLKKGEIIYVEDATVAGQSSIGKLIEIGIGGIIINTDMNPLVAPLLYEHGIPFIHSTELKTLEHVHTWYIVDYNELRNKLDEWMEYRDAWLKEQKELELEKLIKNYRASRT